MIRCPHCARYAKSQVLYTASTEDRGIFRRRMCGICAKIFVSQEVADLELKMPRAPRTGRKAEDRAPHHSWNTDGLIQASKIWGSQ